jgi:hypothetical protein
MPKKSKAGKIVRISAGEGHATTAQDVARLRKSMRHPIQTDDIPELKGTEPRVHRDASRNLPTRRLGPVRQAILESLDDHGMTRYELWKKARAHSGTLSRSAVYEYLRGVRDIGIESAEALMTAANLKVVGESRPKPERPSAGRLKG